MLVPRFDPLDTVVSLDTLALPLDSFDTLTPLDMVVPLDGLISRLDSLDMVVPFDTLPILDIVVVRSGRFFDRVCDGDVQLPRRAVSLQPQFTCFRVLGKEVFVRSYPM